MKKAIMIFFAIVLFATAIVPWIYSAVKGIQFDSNCGDYLKLAADANDIDTAEKRLTTAITYLEDNGITSGHIKVFIYYPKNDIGMWYENLKTAQTQLQEMQGTEYTELEQSNMLMKLRETILDDDGTLTHPEGISMHDNYALMFFLNTVLWAPCMFFGIVLFVYGMDE